MDHLEIPELDGKVSHVSIKGHHVDTRYPLIIEIYTSHPRVKTHDEFVELSNRIIRSLTLQRDKVTRFDVSPIKDVTDVIIVVNINSVSRFWGVLVE